VQIKTYPVCRIILCTEAFRVIGVPLRINGKTPFIKGRNPKEKRWNRDGRGREGTHEGVGAGGLAEASLKLLGAGAGGLHDAVADDARDDATDDGEGQEEGLGVAGLQHQPL